MKQRLYVAGSIIGLLFGAQVMAVSTAEAQVQVAANDKLVRKHGGEVTTSKLATVELTDVSLRTAIDAISRSAGVRTSYDLTMLARYSKTVTLKVREIPVAKAFALILADTDLQMVSMPDGHLAVVRGDVTTPRMVQGVITGKVVHAKTKQPVVGAVVSLDDEHNEIVVGNDGTFRIAAAAGEHRVRVRAVGFVRQVKTVTVESNGTTTLEIVLEQSASVLDEVVVTGTVVATERKAISTPITVITAEEIERRGITRLEQFFRGEVPGVFASDDGSRVYNESSPNGQDAVYGGTAMSKVYTRGASSLNASPNPLKTFVDGVEVMDQSYLGLIDPKSIERIEIITGPQAATIYGAGALGGVMQIFTKKGVGNAAPDITLSLKYGVLESNVSAGNTPMHSDALSIAGGAGPQVTYAGNATYSYTGQWQPALFSRMYGATIGLTHQVGAFRIGGSLSYTRNSNGTIWNNNFGTQPYFVQKRSSGEWLPRADVLQSTQRISNVSSQVATANMDYQAAPFWQHHVTVGRSQNTGSIEPMRPRFQAPWDSLYNEQSFMGSRASWTYNTTLAPQRIGAFTPLLTLGLNGSWGGRVNIQGSTKDKSSTALVSPSVGKPLDLQNWGGFGSFRLGVFDKLYVTLGLRAERSPAYGENHAVDWTPTNGVAYSFDLGEATVKLLGSYGSATRSPTMLQRKEVLSTINEYYSPSQYASQLEAPWLTPEYERGPQGGIEIYYGSLGSLTINRYRQTVSNLIVSVVVDSIPRLYAPTGEQSGFWRQNQNQNLAKIQKHGWEFSASANIRMFTLKSSYSWNDSRVMDLGPKYTGSLRAGEMFEYVPSHTAYASIGYAHGGTSVIWSLSWIGKSLADVNNDLLRWDQLMGRVVTYLDRRGLSASVTPRPSYAKSDLAMQHRVNQLVSLSLDVTNLNNSFQSDTWAIYPSLGRQTMLGVSLRRSAR